MGIEICISSRLKGGREITVPYMSTWMVRMLYVDDRHAIAIIMSRLAEGSRGVWSVWIWICIYSAHELSPYLDTNSGKKSFDHVIPVSSVFDGIVRKWHGHYTSSCVVRLGFPGL
jgi:hypothetical protein